MTKPVRTKLALLGLGAILGAQAQDVRITVQANQPSHRLPRTWTGACIEDVNHEIYGGLYSQMIFGESFQEPAPTLPPKGFRAFGGRWRVQDGALEGSAGDGPKLVHESSTLADGEVGAEVFLSEPKSGNAGLIVRVTKPGLGADKFDGYEISLDATAQVVRLGRHRHNWEHIRDTPCEVPLRQWIPLTVKMTGPVLEIFVRGQSVIRHDDGSKALPAGSAGLRQWQREAVYRNFWIRSGAGLQRIPFQRSGEEIQISGLWGLVQRGEATGACRVVTTRPFLGAQSQRIELERGAGEFGIENQGLNRWGMYFAGGQEYEGILWARAERSVTLCVALESADGSLVHAEKRLEVKAGDWQRLEFTLTPQASQNKGRFAVKLKEPGAVDLGYAFLEPGPWGRFKDLPVRRDVAEALIDQGITVLRYGGSMINHPEYRWKKMIGPRDRRPPYRGTWYPHSSNGWGILDFMEFCEAAGFSYVPAFNLGETPQDMADFIEYAQGGPENEWGRRRINDGHPAPYQLRYLQLGNEERVDEKYAATFEALAQAIWAKDPTIILVVGDFVYPEPITDPMNVRGAASRITQMTGQQKILELARQHGREVWFDIHIWTGDPFKLGELRAVPTYVQALEKIAGGAAHKVVIFEFNANNHDQRRALANAWALGELARLGDRIPIICSANCLQPDGQNDNGWDQGLLFLNPAQVWLQPPGWVTRMISRNHEPLHVPVTIVGADLLHVSAKRSESGQSLVLQAVNLSDKPVPARLTLEGFRPSQPVAMVEELAGPLDVVNTAAEPERLKPKQSEWQHGFAGGAVRYTFSPNSFTVLRFE